MPQPYARHDQHTWRQLARSDNPHVRTYIPAYPHTRRAYTYPSHTTLVASINSTRDILHTMSRAFYKHQHNVTSE